jgi:hypothetical protein
MKSWISALLCGVCLIHGSTASDRPAQLTWDAFSAYVNGHCSIRMTLPDGTLIEGHPVIFRPEALEIAVYKTSDRQLHSKSRMTVPRESVSVVDIRKSRKRGRLIGTLVPLGIGAGLLAGATARSIESPIYGPLVAGGLTMVVGTPVGYFIGRAFDRRFERFIIFPKAERDNPQPGRPPHF